MYGGGDPAREMATSEGELSFPRLGVRIALVALVVLVVLSDPKNPAFAAIGLASGALLLLMAVDAIREHPLYPVAFGAVIALAGVIGIVINGPGFFVALLVIGGLGLVADWGYRRYERS